MKDKYLPIGTVCMLKNGKKRVMITGFCAIPVEDKSKIYDYSGCIFPEGFLTSNQICLFNHDQIEKIFHMGFQDESQEELNKVLQKSVETRESKNVFENKIIEI